MSFGSFNQVSGIEEQQALEQEQQALHLSTQLNERLMTAEGLDNFWKNMSTDPDFEKYGAMRVAERQMEFGNEDMGRDILERASISGGKLGVVNKTLSEAIDKKFERFDGSISANISASGRDEHEDIAVQGADPAALDDWSVEEQLALDVPEISYVLEEGPQRAVEAVAIELAERGVDMDEIDDAMKASNSYDVLQNLTELAQDEGFNDIADYNTDVQVAFADQGVPEAIQNIAPDIAHIENAPKVAMNDFDYNERQPQAFGAPA